MIQLNAEEILHLQVECSDVLEVKQGLDGYLRVIPITGGVFDGLIHGTIVNGGADWNTEKNKNCAHVFAKYLLQTEDGEYIAVENQGILEYETDGFIKTTPKFTADETGKYGWLNHGVYVGSLEPGKGNYAVEIRVFRLL
jgi:hypothetical protein